MRSCNVMTYNIRHGTDAQNRHTLVECGRLIVNELADVVALQEVDRRWGERSNNEDLLTRLAELTGLLHTCFAAAITNKNEPAGYYGNAILSRYPVEKFESHALPRCPGREERRALEAVVAAGPVRITFFNTHLCLDRNTASEQLRHVISLASERSGPVLIMGDFNSGPDDSPMRRVFEDTSCAFRDVEWTLDRRHTFTYPADRPEKKIDYVLANSEAMKQASGLRVLDTQASDHRPVMMELNPEKLV